MGVKALTNSTSSVVLVVDEVSLALSLFFVGLIRVPLGQWLQRSSSGLSEWRKLQPACKKLTSKTLQQSLTRD